MKKQMKFLAIGIIALGLLVAPGYVFATIGENAGTGKDANGVIFTKGWVSGLDFSSVATTYSAGKSWYESYNDGTNTWGNWFEISSYTDPANYATSGDYEVWSTLSDKAGGTALTNIFKIDGVSSSKREMVNSVSGFYWLDSTYNDTNVSAGAYYEQTEYTLDPGSGMIDWRYSKNIDSDGDGAKDDWRYQGWKSYEPGTGLGTEGHDFYNYVDGYRENFDYEYNKLTGYFEDNKDIYLDKDLDGIFTDNYYAQYDESYDAYNGSYNRQYQEWDFDGVKYGSAAHVNDTFTENRSTGQFNKTLTLQQDTDSDKSWGDYAGFGAAGGAFYYFNQEGLNLDAGPQSYAYNEVWDPSKHQHSLKESSSWSATGSLHSRQLFEWDANNDGVVKEPDDYKYDLTNNYDGISGLKTDNLSVFYDYVSTYANKQSYNMQENLLTGQYNKTQDKWIDNDGDKDFTDYENKGAYYYHADGFYNNWYGQTGMNEFTWDPAGGYDGTTFGTYVATSSNSFPDGSSHSSTKYVKDTDNDGLIETGAAGHDLYQTASVDYFASNGLTVKNSWSSEDISNSRDKYQYASIHSENYLAGSYSTNMETANLGGYVSYDESFDAAHKETRKSSEIRTWGVDRKYTETWSYAAGDSGTISGIELDMDANTKWDNTDNYEAYASSWDVKEGSFRHVGYATGDANTGDGKEFAYDWYMETTSPSYDERHWRHANVDPGIRNDADYWDSDWQSNFGPRGIPGAIYSTNAWEQTFRYASGGTAPAFGTYRKSNSTADPYSYASFIYTAEANFWYLNYYEKPPAP
jgi:hypothetical protein